MATTSITSIVLAAAARILSSNVNSNRTSANIEESKSNDQELERTSLESTDNQKAPRVTAVSPISTTYSDESETIATLLDEKYDHQRPRIATAVTPTANHSGAGNREYDRPASEVTAMATGQMKSIPPTVGDSDEVVKPISLDDFEQETENTTDPDIGIELVRQLSFDTHCDDQNGDVADKGNNDTTKVEQDNDKKKKFDDCSEHEWAKKIAAMTNSSGNLVEDLDCGESSTGSMTTIIDSEQSSAAYTDDDLEYAFQSEDEVENDSTDDDSDNVDPLHSSCFVVFGDEYDGSRACTKDRPEKLSDVQMKRPKTSKINPMTGEKSLTDDMQEWKENVLSSWTLQPKKERRKYTKRGHKKKIGTKDQHCYPLRRKMKTTKSILYSCVPNSLGQKCRELRNIADFNRPGTVEECGADSVLSDNLEIKKQKVIIKKESPPPKQESKNSKETQSRVCNQLQPKDEKNESSTSIPTSKSVIGKIERRITRNYLRFVSAQNNKSHFSTRDESLLLRKRNENESKGGNHRTRPIMPRAVKCKKDNEKTGVSKQKGPKVKTLPKSRKPLPKVSKRKYEGSSNINKVSIGATRIAKRFIFNQLRRKGQDKTRIFFGTVSGKYSDTEPDGDNTDIWHIVYDDGDEQYFSNAELKRALELYTNSKRLDPKRRDILQKGSKASEKKRKEDAREERNSAQRNRSRQIEEDEKASKKQKISHPLPPVQ